MTPVEVLLTLSCLQQRSLGKLVGNGHHRATRQSKIQSKFWFTVQSMSPVQSPESRFCTNPKSQDLSLVYKTTKALVLLCIEFAISKNIMLSAEFL